MAAVSCSLCSLNVTWRSTHVQKHLESSCQVAANRICHLHYSIRRINLNYAHQKAPHFYVFAASERSTKSSESEENVPSWAKPDADESPPWARDEGRRNNSNEGFEPPFYVYLLASAITAIAAIGSIFEYTNQKPVFGLLSSDSIFYAPLLGFFAFTGIPTSAFLWFKSVQAANKEAEEQDQRDGFR